MVLPPRDPIIGLLQGLEAGARSRAQRESRRADNMTETVRALLQVGQALKQRAEVAERRVAELQQEANGLNDEVSRLRNGISGLSESLENADGRVAALDAEVAGFKGQLNALTADRNHIRKVAAWAWAKWAELRGREDILQRAIVLQGGGSRVLEDADEAGWKARYPILERFPAYGWTTSFPDSPPTDGPIDWSFSPKTKSET